MSSKKPSRTGRTSRGRRNSHKTPEAEEKYLSALRLGKSIAAAARAASIGRRTAYDWRDRDAAFAARWDEAWEIGTDYLEDLALKGAEQGSERLLLALLKARRPDRYQRMVVEHEGSLEVLLRHASETLDQKLARLAGG
jgi:hypothetical protein